MSESRLKSIIFKAIHLLPLLIVIFIKIFSNLLPKLHPAFYIVITLLHVFFLIVCVYYLSIFIIRRSSFNTILLSIMLLFTIVIYGNSLVSFNLLNKEKEKDVSVMTWNIQRLGAFDKEKSESTCFAQLESVIQKEKPDIIILQEISLKQVRIFANKFQLNKKHYKWSDYYGNNIHKHGGIAIIVIDKNNWKISSERTLNFPPKWKYIYAELVNKENKVINLLGVHIAPPNITESNIDTILDFSFSNPIKAIEQTQILIKTYSTQLKLQNKQVSSTRKIVTQFKDPTIVAGDFNSSPELPFHSNLRDNLKDCWLEAGNGIGSTRLWNNLIPLRIDYIYCTKEFDIKKTKTLPKLFSDHNAVITKIAL